MFVARVGQAVGKVAVVGHEHQALAGFIQTADGIEVPRQWDQIAHGLAILPQFIFKRGNDAARFVEDDVGQLIGLEVQGFAIYFDDIALRVSFVTETGYTAVEAHTSGGNDRLIGAAGAKAGLGHEFL